MQKRFVFSIMLFTIFLDFFNLGLIYPIFTSMVFEGNGGLILKSSSDLYKNALFGLLIALFPFGQFLGAPVIGQLSDQYGRRKLLILTLLGTVASLLVCACGVILSSLSILLLGRFAGGLMAGNMTLAYASLADYSSADEKVKNFALIPLVTGLGFALGPYLAAVLGNPELHPLAGPALPFLFAVILAGINLLSVIWKFPETFAPQKEQKYSLNTFKKMQKTFRKPVLRSYLWILFLMLSANLLFVQYVGPFAIERFHLDITQVGYLYVNIGFSVSLGHLFLTRRLADHLSSEKALMYSLISLGVLLVGLLFSGNLVVLHLFTFLIMLACAVAYTNAMALVSNKATKEQQGEVMGVAVSVQSCSEFLPAVILGAAAALWQPFPLAGAAFCAFWGCMSLRSARNRVLAESESKQWVM